MGVLALLPALYLMAAIYGTVLPGRGAMDPSAKTHMILLVKGPIHYDLLLPLNAETRARFAPLGARDIQIDHPDARWLVVGYGALEFYTQTPTYRELALPALWQGVIGDEAVLRFDIVGTLAPGLPVRAAHLTESQYEALLNSIYGSLALDPGGQPDRITAAGYSVSDGFFAAKGRFSLLRTCNVWIAEQLRAAGLRFGLWTPMPLSVSLSFDLYQAE